MDKKGMIRKTDDRKTERVVMRVTPEEKEMLEAICQRKHITISEELALYIHNEFHRIERLSDGRMCAQNG